MKNAILKIFGTSTKLIPDNIISRLLNQFPDAINIEWEIKDDNYEAVFYMNDKEYIAKISKENEITGYKSNLKIEELPEDIKTECEKSGEIMNAIAIYTKSNHLFEIIVRDKEFNRSLLLLSKSGELLQLSKI